MLNFLLLVGLMTMALIIIGVTFACIIGKWDKTCGLRRERTMAGEGVMLCVAAFLIIMALEGIVRPIITGGW